MIEITGNLWTVPADFRVITTNGSIRRDGCAVMGRGCAREAATIYPALPRLLGMRLETFGNHVQFFSELELGSREGVFTFPVKHHWEQRADVALIARSVMELCRVLLPHASYVMPRPGCGNGGLRWEAVREVLTILPDNVRVIDFDRAGTGTAGMTTGTTRPTGIAGPTPRAQDPR